MPSSRIAFVTACLLTAPLLGCGGPAASPPEGDAERQQATTATPEAELPAAELPEADPAAVELLGKVAAAYRDADSYYDNAVYRESILRQGDAIPYEPPGHQITVAFERPNRFKLLRRVPTPAGPDLVVSAASDGKRATATLSDLPDQFLSTPAPETLTAATVAGDPVLRQALLPVPLANLFPQFELLLATEDAPAPFFAEASPQSLDDRALDGATYRRVELVRPEGAYTLWIDPETHLLHRIDIPTEELRRQSDPNGVVLQWRLWIELRDATAGALLSRDLFRLEPPEGARTVDAFAASE